MSEKESIPQLEDGEIANLKRLSASIAQLEAGEVVQRSLIASMPRIRDEIAMYGYAELGELEELTPAQAEELEMYGFHQIQGSRRIARK